MKHPQWGMLPDVLGIGPGRTGTTWLHYMLAGGVDLPRDIKETNFFSRNYARDIEWYARFFRRAQGNRPVVEICPYMDEPRAPERIREYMPDCKFILTLRDPVDRMYSHYKMMRGYAFTSLPVEGAFEQDRFLAKGSQYAERLTRWFAVFPRENFLVTMYDELRARPQAYLDQICDFIGIARYTIADRPQRRHEINSFDRAPRSRKLAQNARHLRNDLRDRGWHRTANLLARMGVWAWCAGGGEKFPSLTSQQDAHFRRFYLPDVEALERLLHLDLSRWKHPRESKAA